MVMATEMKHRPAGRYTEPDDPQGSLQTQQSSRPFAKSMIENQ